MYYHAGLYKRSTLQVFSFYSEWYGQELGLKIFNEFHEATKEIKNYQPYQLAILIVRIMLDVVINCTSVIKSCSDLKLVKQLERQVIQMAVNARMTRGVEMFLKILRADWERLDNFRIRISTSGHRTPGIGVWKPTSFGQSGNIVDISSKKLVEKSRKVEVSDEVQE